MTDHPRLERETYLKEREALVSAEGEQCQHYDKAILVLSGGALGLSLTFLKDVVPTYEPGTLRWLVLGWISLIVSLLATLSSLQTSQLALRKQRDILDSEFYGNVHAEQRNCFGAATNALNIASLVLFILGVALIALFVLLNLTPMETNRGTWT